MLEYTFLERHTKIPNYGLQDLPHFPTPGGMSSSAYLRWLCQQSLPTHYPDPAERVRQQLAHELAVIDRAGLANYFLIVWEGPGHMK